MCGIVGCIGTEHLPHRSDAIREMRRTIYHRGPDEGGQMEEGPVALGMQRLSILDLAHGTQPMDTPDGRFSLIFNGEVYNFQELRQELENKGRAFRTNTDTEVVLQAFAEWGTHALHRFNGMWALAVWDRHRRRLTLSRDRLGKKPLYLWRDQDTVWFASEMQAFGGVPGFEAKIRPDALECLLRVRYVPGPDTILKGVSKLEPGTNWSWSQNGERTERYWSPPRYGGNSNSADLLHLLEDAVARRMVADVPVGAFLSGGIDSSLVAALMARTGAPVRTFSIGFEEAAYDESSHAEFVAETIGADHRTFFLRPADLEKNFSATVKHMDEPTGDPAALPTYVLAKMAAQRVKVVLTGEGGDEVFGGYSKYRWDHRIQWIHAGITPLGRALVRYMRQRVPALSSTTGRRRLASVLGAPDGGSRMLAWDEDLDEEGANALRRLGLSANGLLLERYMDQWRQTQGDPHLARMQSLDLRLRLVDQLLMKVDKMTMAASIEARCPLLDYRVVEAGAGIPVSQRIRGARVKAPLLNVAEQVLPSAVLARPKQTFSLPLADWLRGPLADQLAPMVEAESPLAHAVDGNVMRKMASDHLDGRSDHSRTLWSLIVINAWLEQLSKRMPVTWP